MLPEEFIKRIETQPYIDAESLLKSLREPSPSSIRINRSKWNRVPAGSEPVPWCSTGYYLRERPSFTSDPLFHAGCYYPQEASGMFIGEVIRQKTGERKGLRILDLCGAPGGKSIHLSDMAGEGSLLVSNEVIRQRASVLAETIAKWGTGNTIVTQNDASVFGRLSGYFDLILVDAPCSGEGMFRSSVASDEWSAANAYHCSERQKRILIDIWPALREGGILIYSTCTFNPAENEENIYWLAEQKEAESLRMDISEFTGIKEIEHKGIYGYGFYPDRIRGEGLFVSVIRKKDKQETVSREARRKSDFIPGRTETSMASQLYHDPAGKFLKRGDEVIAIPCRPEEYLFLFGNLNIVRGGTSLFTSKGRDIIPAHELALSRMMMEDAFPRKELNLDESLKYLRREAFATDMKEGWNIVTYNKIPLGFVKNIGRRINNYYPVEWRIRMDVTGTARENIIQWQ